jgi:hypothetical protein
MFIDINECIEWIFNCSATLRCENTIGSYKCQCEQGLYWIENKCQGNQYFLHSVVHNDAIIKLFIVTFLADSIITFI